MQQFLLDFGEWLQVTIEDFQDNSEPIEAGADLASLAAEFAGDVPQVVNFLHEDINQLANILAAAIASQAPQYSAIFTQPEFIAYLGKVQAHAQSVYQTEYQPAQ